MSGSGNPWDPKRPDGSYYNPFPDGAAMAGSGIDLPPASNVGLFGSGYATWKKNQAANGTLPSPTDFGAPTDFSTDGTGLPPSVTLTANLPMHADPFASLQQVLGFTNDDLGLPAPAGAQPATNVIPGSGSDTPGSFNLYDKTHDVLNTPIGSEALQAAQDLARSFEDNGNEATLVGLGGAGVGVMTVNPELIPPSLVLAGLGRSFNEFGKKLDAGTSFLKSIQQDNSKPLNDFGIRAVTPDFIDLVPDRN